MGAQTNGYITTNNNQERERKLIYGLFIVLSGVLVALAVYGMGYLGLLVPATFLAVAYSKRMKWETPLKVYLAILFLVPKAPYKMLGGLPIELDPSRLFLVLILFLWVSMLLVNPALKIRKTGIEAPLFGLFAILVISVAVNLDSFSYQEVPSALKAILLFVIYIFIFYLLTSIVRDYPATKSLARWLVSLTIFISVFAIIERFTGYNPFKHIHEFLPFLNVDMTEATKEMTRGELRVSGPADHPIALAALLTMFLPLLLYFFYQAESLLKKSWYALGIIATLTAAFFTISATALVGVIVVILSQLFLNPRRGLTLLIIVVIFALCAGMFFGANFKELTDRVSYKHIVSSEVGNNEGRLTDYPRVLQKFAEKPLFGMGFGTFDPERYFYLDNQYLGFIVETGVVGILAFLWLLYSLIKSFRGFALKAEPGVGELVSSLLSSVLVFAAVCFTFDTFGFADVVYAFFIIAGLGSALVISFRDKTLDAQ
ncbi:MAG: O-antigen ligase family protein [Candidatus Aquicultor sp.]